VRLGLVHIAKGVNVSSTRVSFTAAINLIGVWLRWLTPAPDRRLLAMRKKMWKAKATSVCKIKERTEPFSFSPLFPTKHPFRYKH